MNNDNPFARLSARTPQEERDLVETCKELNSHAQGLDRKHLGSLAIDCLKLRPVLNVGRDYVLLNHNARQMLKRGEPSAEWFTHFFADHPDVTEKRPGSEELMRAM